MGKSGERTTLVSTRALHPTHSSDDLLSAVMPPSEGAEADMATLPVAFIGIAILLPEVLGKRGPAILELDDDSRAERRCRGKRRHGRLERGRHKWR